MTNQLKKTTNKSSRQEIGAAGERRAAAFLMQNEHTIIGCNLRFGRLGEIDILSRAPDGTLVVVEVKTRTGDFTNPAANITATKQQHLRRLARVVASQYPKSNVRIDVIEVLPDQINHIEDV